MKTRDFLLKSLRKALSEAVKAGKIAHTIALSKEIERLDSIPEGAVLKKLQEAVQRHENLLQVRTLVNGRMGTPG